MVVPGRRDVNLDKCAAYFLDRKAEDQEAAEPYWPKWEPFATMFTRLFDAEFRMDQPWQFAEIPELNLAVAGLTQRWPRVTATLITTAGWGKNNCDWVARRMERAQANSWFRIGVLYHSPMSRAGSDESQLLDADLFASLVATRLNMVVHGQADVTRETGLGVSDIPILGRAGRTEFCRHATD